MEAEGRDGRDPRRRPGTDGAERAAGLRALLERANAGRAAGAPDLAAERELERRHRVSRVLAVYGSLAPGRENAGQLAGLGGAWLPGTVRGRLHPLGWGATAGYPGLRPEPDGDLVAVQVLVSPDLARGWARLDAFEGPDYRRLLVPVSTRDPAVCVANLYAVRELPDGGS